MKPRSKILQLHLAQPFTTTHGSTDVVRQIVVRLERDGYTGLGTSLFSGKAATAMAAAHDMALHDLHARLDGASLREHWGIADVPIGPTAVSIGVASEAELLARARQLARWPIIKLKITPTLGVRAVARLREVYSGRVWIDGNGAWDIVQAVNAAETLACYGVELLEQPIPAGDPQGLRFIRERSPLPIVADEDCSAADDIARLRGCVDVVNIKLVKCGGLRNALHMIELARSAGMRVMLGCKTESTLGVTAMAQLAGLADYLDLDGHLDLLDDPFVGIGIEHGRITLPTGAGLGVEFSSSGALT